jgi:hypothetical protein
VLLHGNQYPTRIQPEAKFTRAQSSDEAAVWQYWPLEARRASDSHFDPVEKAHLTNSFHLDVVGGSRKGRRWLWGAAAASRAYSRLALTMFHTRDLLLEFCFERLDRSLQDVNSKNQTPYGLPFPSSWSSLALCGEDHGSHD